MYTRIICVDHITIYGHTSSERKLIAQLGEILDGHAQCRKKQTSVVPILTDTDERVVPQVVIVP